MIPKSDFSDKIVRGQNVSDVMVRTEWNGL